MKISSLTFGMLFLLALASCDRDNRAANDLEDETANADAKTPVKLIEYLIGEWEMTNAADQSNKDAGPGERIKFTTEARYIAYDGGEQVDSGAYRMNEQLNNLYLAGESDESPREYELQMGPGQMTLTPSGGDSTRDKPRYVYRRISPAAIPPGKTDMAEDQSK